KGAPPAGAPGAKPKVGDLTAEMIISKIIPDERSNQLIVIATERHYQRVKRMVTELDREISDITDSRIHVYYCENANCDELAQTLGAVTGVTVTVSAGGGRRRGGQARAVGAAGRAPGPRHPRRRRRRRPAVSRRASRTCCSRATCASTSIARPTR